MPSPQPDNLDLLIGHALVGGVVAWATHQAGHGLVSVLAVALLAVAIHHLFDAPAAKGVALVRKDLRFNT
jgi:hypothetical protein